MKRKPTSKTAEGDAAAGANGSAEVERARLAAIVDSSEDAIISKTLDGVVTSWNAAAERLYGYTAAEAVGRHISFIVPPELRGQVDEIQARLRSEGAGTRVETVRVRKNGSRVEVAVTVSPVHNASGEVIGASTIARDITELKRAKEELARAEESARESAEQFRTLADSIPQLAWMADETGSIFWYNRRWYEYTGTTFEEMSGWGWQKVHHPDEVERVTSRFRRAVAAGEPWEDTFPLLGRDGEYRRFLSRAVPLRDAAGRVVRWFGTNTDVEEQKQAEALLERLNEERECMLEEVSTPVVPVLEGVLVLPLIGSLDTLRAERATRAALAEVTRQGARVCILDITGARIIDSHAVAHLTNLVQALKLVGADAFVTGVGAQVAQTLVGLGLDMQGIRTFRTLAQALAALLGGGARGNGARP